MKRFVSAVLLSSMLLLVSACSTTKPVNPGVLPTGAEIDPIPGCQDLRARGGSC